MWYALKLYIRDPWIYLPFAFSLIIVIVSWWYLISYLRPIEGGVFLHYDIIIGPNLLGEWWKLYYFPLASSILCLINQLLSYAFYFSDKTLAKIFSASTCLLELFLLTALSLVVGINF